MDHEKGNGITGADGANVREGSGGQADYGSAGPQVTGSEHQADDSDGDDDAGRGESDAAAAAPGTGIGGDPGAPGGMGGVHSRIPNPDHRPNGGVSPMQGDEHR
jgi:hypothetical protein